MGDLRFRVTPSSDPSSFNDGADLLQGDEIFPWNRPILRMAKSERYEYLCEQLVADGLISRELLERCRLIWKNSSAYTFYRRPHQTLYHLNQPILLPFHYHTSVIVFRIVGKEKFSQLILGHPYFRTFLTGMGTLFLIS